MLKYQKKECIGCKICEVVCSMEHEQEINTKKSRIRYQDDWPQIGQVNVCRNCAAQACIKACEPKALVVSQEGHLVLDKTLCDGCLACSEACPFGTLPVDGKYPLYCDTCKGKYECVKWCPTKALKR